jgi:hypothetical protein
MTSPAAIWFATESGKSLMTSDIINNLNIEKNVEPAILQIYKYLIHHPTAIRLRDT